IHFAQLTIDQLNFTIQVIKCTSLDHAIKFSDAEMQIRAHDLDPHSAKIDGLLIATARLIVPSPSTRSIPRLGCRRTTLPRGAHRTLSTCRDVHSIATAARTRRPKRPFDTLGPPQRTCARSPAMQTPPKSIQHR